MLNNLANPVSTSNGHLLSSSRERFEHYRKQVTQKELPAGGYHSTDEVSQREKSRAFGHSTRLAVFSFADSLSLANIFDSAICGGCNLNWSNPASRDKVCHRLWTEPQAAARAG